jgi:hypothetical protein
MNGMLRRQNFRAVFLARDSPASLPDGSDRRIRIDDNRGEAAGLPSAPQTHYNVANSDNSEPNRPWA